MEPTQRRLIWMMRWNRLRWRARKDAREYKFGGGWGDSIQQFTDAHWHTSTKGLGSANVHGWKTPMPRVGDVLLMDMRSGETRRGVFREVRYCGDPEDMFFAVVAWVD